MKLLNAGPGGGPQTRFTKADISSFSVDIGFPGGLGGIDKDGKKVGVEATFTLRYRKVGTETWATRPISVYAKLSGKPFTRTFAYDVTDRGLYEIEITRTSGDFDRPDQDFSKKEIQRTGRSQWSVLRSFRPEYPINFDAPLAVSAIRIRATGQLNGTLDEYNCDAFCICPDWDAASGTWIERETQNPASLFRHVPDGPGRRLSAHGRRGRRAGRLARLLCRERPDVQPDPPTTRRPSSTCCRISPPPGARARTTRATAGASLSTAPSIPWPPTSRRATAGASRVSGPT